MLPLITSFNASLSLLCPVGSWNPFAPFPFSSSVWLYVWPNLITISISNWNYLLVLLCLARWLISWRVRDTTKESIAKRVLHSSRSVQLRCYTWQIAFPLVEGSVSDSISLGVSSTPARVTGTFTTPLFICNVSILKLQSSSKRDRLQVGM